MNGPAIVRRAMAYAWPDRFALAVRAATQMMSIFWILVLPWPAKLIIDRIILGAGHAASGAATPFFFRPFVAIVDGLDPARAAWVMGGILLAMLALMGAFGADAGQRSAATPVLAEGHDAASRAENQINAMSSLISGAFGLFESLWTLDANQRLNHRLRSDLFAKLMAQPVTAHAGRPVGESVFRALYDAPTVGGIVFNLWVGPATCAINLATTILVMMLVFRNEPLVVWCALAVAPLNFTLTLGFAGVVRRLAGKAREASASATAVIEEQATNMLALQALAEPESADQGFADASAIAFRRFRLAALAVIGGSFTTTVVGASMIFAVLWLAAPAFISGALAPGDWWVIWGYYGAIAASADYLGKLWLTLQEFVAGMGRVFEVLDAPAEPDLGAMSTGDEPSRITEGLAFRGVGFSYREGTRALDGVDLDIRIGQMTAIVGPTGAGKTTLAYLIPGLLHPDAGRISVDGRTLDAGATRFLRAQTAFVFQEASLFDATIAENIRMGRPEATDEAVRAAAARAGALEFIEQLPEGFDARVGRSGARLSFGQKQRIAIARALVSERPILVLDEPTAALDPATERRLAEDLAAMRKSHAVVVVAHRLATIAAADQILFIEGGRVAERGDHATLMRAEGPYARFVSMQTL